MSDTHVPTMVLERYVAGRIEGDTAAAWTVEAHLESCGACRDTLADVVERADPAAMALILSVGTRLHSDVARAPRAPSRPSPLRSRHARALAARLTAWRRSWTAPATLPRVLMTVLVLAAAVLLDALDEAMSGALPSLVLLVAPVAPLAGVAAAWSRGLDPAYELVAASPRAGLDLVLRRTLVVLAVVIPALSVAGALTGLSPAGWLVPCLAFTAGTLALGELMGLQRAARVLAAGWGLAVAAPSLALREAPVLLDPAGWPAWLAVLLAITTLLAVRRHAYTRPARLR